MTQDFYLKTRFLHEKFQKKELHYLNLERKLSSTDMWKKDLNLPLQEYLQKINLREMETEAAYKNIMKQMEDLDECTNSMYLKLEKLGILQNNIQSFQLYDTTKCLNAKSTFPQFVLNESLSLKSPSESMSTQTENNIYCNKCSSIIHISNHQSSVENVPFYINTLSEKEEKSQVTFKLQSQDTRGSLLSQDDQNHPQFINSSLNADHFTLNENKNFAERNSEIDQASQKSEKQVLPSEVVLDERQNTFDNNLVPNKCLTTEKSLSSVAESKEILIESQVLVNKTNESKSVDSEAIVEGAVSKSDAESMNNEFDFLESDSANIFSKPKTQDSLKGYKSPSEFNMNADKTKSHARESPLQHKKDKEGVFQPNPKLNLGDNKSDTSGSVSGCPSPNASVASDSDSVYEKGSSVTASAAYQALLGNTVVPTKAKKIETESESEDEIESALSSTVRKTHVKSRLSNSNRSKEKAESQQVDAEPPVVGSKPLIMNKQQSKLSKNTRKVLGLDTSSGSEAEMAVKVPAKKIDEDEDEFDFYD